MVKMDTLSKTTGCCIAFIFLFLINATAQQYDCNFTIPAINIDFGTSTSPKETDLSALKNYKNQDTYCPDDGNYIFASYTSDCFGGFWYRLNQDHTPNDVDGRMMIVNAAYEPATFFEQYVSGLKQGTTYEFSVWIVNICRDGNCSDAPTPPIISISLSSGINEIARFETGQIFAGTEPKWKKYFGTFTVPPGANIVVIKMDDVTTGGCGNDFAMDDIMIKECRLPNPVKAVVTKPVKPAVVIAATAPAVKNEAAKTPVIFKPPVQQPAAMQKIINKNIPEIDKSQIIKPSGKLPLIKEKSPGYQLPAPIAARANPIIKQIETAATEMLIELYDNGEIDGDTVTIFHNNQLLVSHAGLSEKPVRVKINVDKVHPHHELIMVADNLGSIPPNTSLMIITANNKRYEIFISSSEQKNARIVIDLKE
jgi:hypothetical protein